MFEKKNYCQQSLKFLSSYSLGLILNCAVFGALMRPLNIVIEETEVNNEVNTEPGVHSELNISKLKNTIDNKLTKSELVINKGRINNLRSVSESRAPQLEELLRLDKTHSSSSHLRVFVPPMARKDIFYSGSTLNLKSESFENFGSVPSRISSKHNNNNDTKRLHKLSATSDSPGFFNRLVKGNRDYSGIRINVKDVDEDEDKSCAIVRNLFDLSVLRQPAMALLSVSNVFGMAGYYIPFVYITQHVRKSIKGIIFLESKFHT